MNYRHIYHAGNFADVLKHAALLAVLEHLRAKDKPFFVLDTHAGRGLYPLDAPQALKTRESAQGVEKILADPGRSDLMRAYVTQIRRVPGNEAAPRVYPGSPWLIRAMLRESDRAVFVERHPEEEAALRESLPRDLRLRIALRNGYEDVRALLPPPSRRGLVLIDPPFESPDEWADMTRAVREGLARFATGTYLLWHPIKSMETVQHFYQSLKALPLPETLVARFFMRPVSASKTFDGTGLVIVNPPWTMADSLKDFLPELTARLAPETGSWALGPLP